MIAEDNTITVKLDWLGFFAAFGFGVAVGAALTLIAIKALA
jgi:hypothetical protein